jgi:hypothetical protein
MTTCTDNSIGWRGRIAMDNRMLRRPTFAKLAAILGALAVVMIAAAPARADGPHRHHRNAAHGAYRGHAVYRGTANPRYNGGWGDYGARGYYAAPRVVSPRPTQLYVPPARVYSGPPGGYYPPAF